MPLNASLEIKSPGNNNNKKKTGAALALLFCALGVTRAGDGSPSILAIENPAPAASAQFGYGVDGIGDVNGDGTPDVVAGAPGKDRAYVFSGADGSMIRELADPEGLKGNRFGFAVRGIGDVNGDGVGDIAVGAPGPDGLIPLPCVDPDGCPPDPGWGRVFLFSGAGGGLIRKIIPLSSEWEGQYFVFGYSVAALGDVNGDGFGDLAVGAPTLLPNSRGQVFAFSGATGAQLWTRIEAGPQTIGSFGQFLGTVGDLNADGRNDLLVTATFHDLDPSPNGYLLGGRVYLLSGAIGATIRIHDSPNPANNEGFGVGLSDAGDQNGDGKSDYLVGKPGASKVYAYSGATGGSLGSFGTPGAPGDFFGVSIARVGDKDADGKEDVWIGASKAGNEYLMTAGGGLLKTVADPTPSDIGTVYGFGLSAAPTGNLGGDAGPDLIVSDPAEIVGGVPGVGAAFLLILPPPNRPPVANAGVDWTVECSGATTPVTLDGSGSTDPDGDVLTYEWREGAALIATGVSPTVNLGDGAHTLTLKVTDPAGASSAGDVRITVVDTTPPVIARDSASPETLWPANHKMLDVTVGYGVSDLCDPVSALTCALGVTSNEPINGTGDGDTSPDWEILDAHRVRLRAERTGTGKGRIYSITITCADSKGNSSSTVVTVTVPNSQGKSVKGVR